MKYKRRYVKNLLILTILVLGTMLIACGATIEEADIIETTTDIVEESKIETVSEEAMIYYEEGYADFYGLNNSEIDMESAYTNFVKAEELGCTTANFYLGILCDSYSYPRQDYSLAKEYNEASGENAYAQIELGYLYYLGRSIESDKEKAKKIWQDVVDNGFIEGKLGLADIASDENDYITALNLRNEVVENATEQIYIARAMKDVGYQYHEGLGVEQDYIKAKEWYEKAAALGNDSAMLNLGGLYFAGGTEDDYIKAKEWYEKAAALGNDSAMYMLGVFYEGGYGVEENLTKAIEWYEKAVALGNTSAEEKMANMKDEKASLSTEELSGRDWASTLTYEEPKLLAWNDETGTKEVIDAGGSYVMKQGDTLAIYHSRDAWVENIEPYDFVEALGPGLYTRIEYIQPDMSQTINMKVEIIIAEIFEKMKGGEWYDEWSGELEDAYMNGKRETYSFTITTP